MGNDGRWTADTNARFVKYYAGNVVLVRGLRGATSELAWRLVPVSRLRFHRPIGFLPHQRRRRYRHATPQALRSIASFPPDTAPGDPSLSIPAALRLPDNDCCAIRPPEALRAAKRKTGIFMPQDQKPTPLPVRACYSDTRRRQISTEIRHR
jgi:hypothetical protein